MHFFTKAIHVGQSPDVTTGAIIPPIVQTSTFAHKGSGGHQQYEYTRAGNPNFTHLEEAVTALEEGVAAVVFSSGLGASTALLTQLKRGDHIVAVDDIYGGTYRLLSQMSAHVGLEVTYIDGEKLEAWEHACRPTTRYVWIETPSNPLLKIIDIAAVCKIAAQRNAISIVDNTFASPYLQRPLTLGADVVVHSTTKYIGGHSDVIGGVVVTKKAELAEACRFARMAYGLNPSPFDVWLTHRGLKTLGLRMEQHVRGGEAVAAFLSRHPVVKKVYYPGLETHPGHALAKKQMKGCGGMVSAEFRVDAKKLKHTLSQFHLFQLAESLGGVESLVNHPATMTHASVPKEVREKRGIHETLVRFSVGIEDPEDLIEDLRSVCDGLR